jgi:tetratricopeptide (TPR) repeat protein
MNVTTRSPGKWMATVACVMLAGAVTVGAEAGYKGYARHRDLLREATKFENEGKYVKAARTYRKSALYANDIKTKATLLVRQGDCFANADKPYDAFDSYRTLLETYPLFVPYDHVVAKLRELAERFVRGDGTFLGFKDKTKAIEVYELIQQEVPAGRSAVEDSMRLAQLLVEEDRYAEAVDTYRTLLKRGVPADAAADVHLELGRVLMELSRRGDGDGTVSRQARDQLQNFLDVASADDPRRDEATFMLNLIGERRAERLYELGEFYTREPHRRIGAARRYLSDAVTEYGDTTAGQMAQLLLANLPEDAPQPQTPEQQTDEEAAPRKATPEAPATKPQAIHAEPVQNAVAQPEPAPPPKQFKPLKERDAVKKYLRPLGDINDLDKGAKTK